jgi:hypothetical protein
MWVVSNASESGFFITISQCLLQVRPVAWPRERQSFVFVKRVCGPEPRHVLAQTLPRSTALDLAQKLGMGYPPCVAGKTWQKQ